MEEGHDIPRQRPDFTRAIVQNLSQMFFKFTKFGPPLNPNAFQKKIFGNLIKCLLTNHFITFLTRKVAAEETVRAKQGRRLQRDRRTGNPPARRRQVERRKVTKFEIYKLKDPSSN